MFPQDHRCLNLCFILVQWTMTVQLCCLCVSRSGTSTLWPPRSWKVWPPADSTASPSASMTSWLIRSLTTAAPCVSSPRTFTLNVSQHRDLSLADLWPLTCVSATVSVSVSSLQTCGCYQCPSSWFSSSFFWWFWSKLVTSAWGGCPLWCWWVKALFLVVFSVDQLAPPVVL